jgi:hypothetical protein
MALAAGAALAGEPSESAATPSTVLTPTGVSSAPPVVVAQTVRTGEPAGDVWWTSAMITVRPGEEPTALPSVAAFVTVVAGDVALLDSDERPRTHLVAGEAAWVPDERAVVALDADATVVILAMMPATEIPAPFAAVGSAFPLGDVDRDLEIRRLEVPPGASTDLGGDTPVVAMLIAGALSPSSTTAPTTTAPAQSTLSLGAPVLVGPGISSMTNAGAETAVVLVAAVGDAFTVTLPEDPVPSTTTSTTTTTTATTAPVDDDSDDDGLTNDAETAFGTDPDDADSDDDGLLDGYEADSSFLDPLDPDSDGDAIDDGDEVNIYGTDPGSSDTDGDGLDDYVELDVYATDPVAFDSDGDLIGDGAEALGNGTDPNNSDTDGDGVDDGTEGANGTDPLDSTSF